MLRIYTTVFDNTPFHTCSTCYAVLQCTTLSNITITIDIDENVFVHMQWHANEEKKELIFRVYCICTYIYMYIHTDKEELSHRIMIDRSTREYYYKTKTKKTMDIICLLSFCVCVSVVVVFKFIINIKQLYSLLTLKYRFWIFTFNFPVKLLFRTAKHFHIKYHSMCMIGNERSENIHI